MQFLLKHWKPITIGVACLVLIGIGYGLALWRRQGLIAGYDRREAARIAEIATKDAEQNRLRGENDAIRRDSQALREHAAKLSAEDEALRAIIDSRGGQIAIEAKNLEGISAELKKDLSAAGNAADACIWCRQLSANALARGQIAKGFECKDECAGAAR